MVCLREKINKKINTQTIRRAKGVAKTQNGRLSNNRKTRLESAIKSAGKVELHLNKKKKM